MESPTGQKACEPPRCDSEYVPPHLARRAGTASPGGGEGGARPGQAPQAFTFIDGLWTSRVPCPTLHFDRQALAVPATPNPLLFLTGPGPAQPSPIYHFGRRAQASLALARRVLSLDLGGHGTRAPACCLDIARAGGTWIPEFTARRGAMLLLFNS